MGKSEPALSGATLLADYVSAMTNITTAKTAQYMAEQTEQDALQTINYAGAQHQSPMVTPGDIAPELQQTLLRTSLNAHLQKAQAQQIDSFTNQELARLEAEAKHSYIGKKLKITVTDPEFQPIESYWLDKNSGDYRQGVYKTKTIKGSIDDLSLEKNLLVIKPGWRSRLLVPDRKFLAVYVVNPASLQPAVELTLL